MRLLLDEMYSPTIAAVLRERGHDAISAAERDDLRSATDAAIFDVMQDESRAIVTNNVRDFVPLAQRALQSGATFCGIIFTSERSVPRNRASSGNLIALLEALLVAHPEEAVPAGVIWLTPSPAS